MIMSRVMLARAALNRHTKAVESLGRAGSEREPLRAAQPGWASLPRKRPASPLAVAASSYVNCAADSP